MEEKKQKVQPQLTPFSPKFQESWNATHFFGGMRSNLMLKILWVIFWRLSPEIMVHQGCLGCLVMNFMTPCILQGDNPFCNPARVLERYCWWFRNSTNKVEIGSLSHYLQGFFLTSQVVGLGSSKVGTETPRTARNPGEVEQLMGVRDRGGICHHHRSFKGKMFQLFLCKFLQVTLFFPEIWKRMHLNFESFCCQGQWRSWHKA